MGRSRLPPAPVGLLMASLDPAGVRSLAAEVAATLPAMQPTFLAPGEVTALEPAVAPEVAACRLEIGFPVEPIAATRAYAADARRAGASLREGVDARPIVQHGRVHGIETVEGDGSVGVRIRSEAVVVAAGPWTPAIVDPSGAWRPISPLWGVVVDAGLADPPRHAIEEVWTGVETSGEPSGTDFSLVTAAGRSSIGSAFLADEPDGDAIAAAILEHAVRFVPSSATASIGATRVCARPLSRRRATAGRPGPGGRGPVRRGGPWPVGHLDRAGRGDAAGRPARRAGRRPAAGARSGPLRTDPGTRLAPAVGIEQEEGRLGPAFAEGA